MKPVFKISDFSLKNNRKLKVFLFFIFLTSIIWLLIQLSKSYTSTAIFEVEYVNLPADKLLQKAPISKLKLAINAPGFSLLKYKASSHKIKLKLNSLTKNKGSYYFLPSTQLSYLNAQISRDVKVMEVLKDTIFVELGKNISKKVPIIPAVEIKFKPGYNYIEKLIVLPDSVILTGPKKQLDSISEISTNSLKLTDVYKDIDAKLQLEVSNFNKNISLSTTKITIFGKVDKFTEGFFKIPVQIINEPENVKVNPFPKEIEVIYQAGLLNFNKINKSSVSIVFDYNQYKADTLIKHLTPVIQQKSEYIHSIKVNPSQIEFLIQK